MEYTPDDMDYVRSAIFNAMASNITFEEFAMLSINAETIADFDNAINILGLATPEAPKVKA